MRLDVIDNHRSRFVPVASGWHQRKMRFAVKSYQTKKNEDENPTVLSLTKTGLKVKTDLSFGKSTENYVGHQIVERGQFVFTPRDFDATPILCGVANARGCISNLYIVFDVAPQIDARFLEYYFWGLKYGFELFEKLSFGMRYSFNRTQFENIPLLHPDLATQRQIVDFLDRETTRIDLLIENKQRLVALLPEKEKNEISRLVMRGSDTSVTFRDTGIFWRGKVPAHWTESRLKAHFRIQKRQGFDDLPVLSVYREYGVIEKSSRNDNINKTPENLSKYQLVDPGDLVINKMKSWQGSLGISSFRGITSPDYVVMIPFAEHHPQYMHHLLRAVPMPTVYHLISNGIRTDQWRMEPDRFLSLPVFLPPMDEQEEIARKVDETLVQLRNVADAINASIDRLKEYRSALITAAVTGQIDVQTYARSGTTNRRLDAIQEEMSA